MTATDDFFKLVNEDLPQAFEAMRREQLARIQQADAERDLVRAEVNKEKAK